MRQLHKQLFYGKLSVLTGSDFSQYLFILRDQILGRLRHNPWIGIGYSQHPYADP